MANVNIKKIDILDNPASVLSPFQFSITLECTKILRDCIELKIHYLIAAIEDNKYDQLLETLHLEPLSQGVKVFHIKARHPDFSKIPEKFIVGSKVLLLSFSYHEQEFTRVLYFVKNADVNSPKDAATNAQLEQLTRNIHASNPRFILYQVNWNQMETGKANNSCNEGPSTSKAGTTTEC